MSAAAPPFRLEPLGAGHDRSAFECESERQTAYFRTVAGQHNDKSISAVYVAVEIASERIAGFYTLSMFLIDAGDLPPELKPLRLPKSGYLPAVLIGRLARDSRFAGQGIGELLVVDALFQAEQAARHAAAVAVVVDAESDAARRFWLGQEFLPLPGMKDRLILPMQAVRKRLRGPA
ncbi:MAG: GNAT family N-acetyltransferase [Alphaproteobacteria bacterium]|nr:GNAT family N-acetyltransferase [Alphaproteobacteria bacterium]